MDLIEKARAVLATEAQALRDVSEQLDDSFARAIDILAGCEGRVILTAVGKSGHIARKIAATLASTGTPAFFLHPTEGGHGDLGMVTPHDVILAISNSGESEELKGILPALQRMRVPIVALCGYLNSTLARASEVTIDISVGREADPLNAAPTASTTAALAVGDAVAVVLQGRKNFTSEDFVVFHPGGALGRRFAKVRDYMHKDEENPVISRKGSVKDALAELTTKGLGAVSITDENEKLVGILTDGDVRRLFQHATFELAGILSAPVSRVMNTDPASVPPDTLCTAAMRIMEEVRGDGQSISVLPIVDEQRHVLGMIRLHDLVKGGFAMPTVSE